MQIPRRCAARDDNKNGVARNHNKHSVARDDNKTTARDDNKVETLTRIRHCK
jgi:hypothetical protein